MIYLIIDISETNRMQRKNMRPLKAMNISRQQMERCHDEGETEIFDEKVFLIKLFEVTVSELI